jgi:hypothetical protein
MCLMLIPMLIINGGGRRHIAGIMITGTMRSGVSHQFTIV